jgi:murein DD-endopeptidase MepM/ murein hydrolase activator NlpD
MQKAKVRNIFVSGFGLHASGCNCKHAICSLQHVANCYILFSFCILNLIGCASTSLVPPPPPSVSMPGIYHRVEKGQTLWRISKIYNVAVDELVNINHISDGINIETGQLIFIPHPLKPQDTANKYPLSEDFIWPMRGKVISTFGQIFNNMINEGINIEPYRTQDVVAARSGRVVFYSPDFKSFGKTIIIDHGDGFLTVYARNTQVFIKTGDVVGKGILIAKAGSVLHFQIRKGYLPQNPYFYLPR